MAGDYEHPRRTRLPRLLGIGVVLVLAAVAAAGLVTLVGDDGAVGVGTASGDGDGELARLTELYEALTDSAVEAPDEEQLVDAAIEAMLDEIDDPYAQYFENDEFASFNQSLDGTFSGVGLVLEDTPDGPVIVSVLEDTPADRAGIEEGERIVSVDGEDVADEPLESIVTKVKGDAGTAVTLGLRGGDEGERTIEVTRAEFDLPVVESETLEGGDVGYVRLFQFTEGSAERVRETVRTLVEDDGVNGVVFDLRGNPGGLLNEAVAVASVFIERGEIVSVQERGTAVETFDAVGDAFDDVPVAVVVDDSSASASEIVAGAVRDADRGPVVGEETFGKGTVQTITRLPDGSGAKFTTARYFTPSGDSIEGVGVEPDIVVEPAENGTTIEDDPQIEAAVDALTGGSGGGG